MHGIRRSLAFVLAITVTTTSLIAEDKHTPFIVTTGNLAVEFSPKGEIVGISTGDKAVRLALTGGTRLTNCQTVGDTTLQSLPDGGLQFTRTVAVNAAEPRARLVETFRPTPNSIRWEIEITGLGSPWTTPIETWLQWPATTPAQWWTAWADPRPGNNKDWADPLVASPFNDRLLNYIAGSLHDPNSFVIPLLVLLDEANDRGLTLALSPEDLALVTNLTVNRDGLMVFNRHLHRIQSERPIRFAMDLVAHPADWRCGLDWMVRRYLMYFDPPNSAVHDFAGCGAYSSHAEIPTPRKFMRMAFRINWKASFDFPYMAMFLPPTQSDTEEWTDFKGFKTSVAQMRKHSQQMRRLGFHVLNYFNVTECGAYYKYPPPPRKAASDADLWKDANDFLYYQVGDAILPGDDGKPIGSWEGCVAMDPGEPVYQEFLLEQALRHIERLPESDGICIDRMDWLRRFNPKRDDGVSWVNNKPARSLAISWHQISEKLGAMMHAAGKVIYVNPLYAHVGMLRHIDGIYDEFGDHPACINRAGLMGLRKPVMTWTRDAAAVRPAPDAYFQRYLHMGEFLTAPIPGNDHTILPAEDTDRYFLDYGPLLDALRGKRWVLLPHVIEVKDGSAKANLFQVPGGYVVPVTFGKSDQATIVLRGLPQLDGQQGFRVEVIQPEQTEWKTLSVMQDGKALTLDAPLVRGCAMIKLAYAWIEPKITYFTPATVPPLTKGGQGGVVEMGTTLKNAVLHYTLDGSMPSSTSPRYEKPFRLERTTKVRAAAFRDDKQIGDVMTTEFAAVPTDAPAFLPRGGGFDATVTVTLIPPVESGNGKIRYTLDGSIPTPQSPEYSGPIQLNKTTTVRAAVLAAGQEGCDGAATYYLRGPGPPLPDVSLADLTPIRATSGWGGQPRINRSITDKPLSLGGKTYARGIGTHAESEIVYDLKSEYKAFVAVVGLDDAMKDHSDGSVVFEVWIDDKLADKSRILRANDYGYLNVTIPAGSKVMRLVVTDAIDGTSCDHGDWADAGFRLKGQ